MEWNVHFISSDLIKQCIISPPCFIHKLHCFHSNNDKGGEGKQEEGDANQEELLIEVKTLIVHLCLF